MITTDRLLIRPIELEDAAFILELVNTDPYLNFIGNRNVTSLALAKEFIQAKMLDHFEKHGYGNSLILDKDTLTPYGTVSLFNRDNIEVVDLGFAVHPDHFRKGIAFEASSAVMYYSKHILNFEKLSAITSKVNTASNQLIQKLGFTYKKLINWENTEEKLLYYEIDL